MVKIARSCILAAESAERLGTAAQQTAQVLVLMEQNTALTQELSQKIETFPTEMRRKLVASSQP